MKVFSNLLCRRTKTAIMTLEQKREALRFYVMLLKMNKKRSSFNVKMIMDKVYPNNQWQFLESFFSNTKS
jgi:hypothetical protein